MMFDGIGNKNGLLLPISTTGGHLVIFLIPRC